MLGAIIGDTVGSVYEFDNTKNVNFQPLIHECCFPTDDSVMSMAVAEWLLTDPERTQRQLEDCMVRWGNRFPDAGYGGNFAAWLFSPNFATGSYEEKRMPYYSWGNGSAMRCSACGWIANSAAEALDLATRSAIITHNHPEGIKGAECTAAAMFLARTGHSKADIAEYVVREFGYDFTESLDQMRLRHRHDETCQDSLPKALRAFMDGESYEDVVRNAVSLGGDTDTLAAIAGAMAEAFYGIPENIKQEGLTTVLQQADINIKTPRR